MSSILIVDDEDSFRELLGHFIERHGVQVFKAKDGCQALQLYSENKPSCVILDLKLPEMNGEEVFQKIRAINPQVKIYLVSGAMDVSLKKLTDKLGANGCLNKPITLEEISEIIKSLEEKK
jgi:DNA-binding response OmpR family regulator